MNQALAKDLTSGQLLSTLPWVDILFQEILIFSMSFSWIEPHFWEITRYIKLMKKKGSLF